MTFRTWFTTAVVLPLVALCTVAQAQDDKKITPLPAVSGGKTAPQLLSPQDGRQMSFVTPESLKITDFMVKSHSVDYSWGLGNRQTGGELTAFCLDIIQSKYANHPHRLSTRFIFEESLEDRSGLVQVGIKEPNINWLGDNVGMGPYKNGSGGIYLANNVVSWSYNDTRAMPKSPYGTGNQTPKPVYHFFEILGLLDSADNSSPDLGINNDRFNAEFDPHNMINKTIPALLNIFSRPKTANSYAGIEGAIGQSILLSHGFKHVPFLPVEPGKPNIGWVKDLNGKLYFTGRQQLFNSPAALMAATLNKVYGKPDLTNHNGRGVDGKIRGGGGEQAMNMPIVDKRGVVNNYAFSL